MRLAFHTNLQEFNETLGAYARFTRKTAEQVLLKKGASLGSTLYDKLRELMPGKGAIRTQRLAAMAAGEGIKVRPAARKFAMRKSMATATNIKTRQGALYREIGRTGKLKRNGLSFWELAVQRELNIRESGRGYLGYSARFKSIAQKVKASGFDAYQKHVIRDRYLRFISVMGFNPDKDNIEFTFKWGGGNNTASDGLARAMQKPKARAKIADALDAETADMVNWMKSEMAKRGTGKP